MDILSTKQLSNNQNFLAKQIGFNVDSIAFIRIFCCPFDFTMTHISSVDTALVFTSVNAVKCFFESQEQHKFIYYKIFSTSGKTQQYLENKAFEISGVAHNAKALVRLICKDESIKKIYHICGNLVLKTLEEDLMKNGVEYNKTQVYETRFTPRTITKSNYKAILFFSPSGVDSFLQQNKLNLQTVYCCIGLTTANYLKQYDDSLTILHSSRPTIENMLKKLKQYFNDSVKE